MIKNVLWPFEGAVKADNPNWRDEIAASTITHTDLFDNMPKTENKERVNYNCSHPQRKGIP